jgi:hypothetical protein
MIAWSQLSVLSKDFFAKSLVLDQNERLTADQAMHHPWLTNSIVQLRENCERLGTLVSCLDEQTHLSWNTFKFNDGYIVQENK